ncbi:hypothetical protein Bca52824_009953 [Brassica carinata]|uniref:Uncharacterized protein n=1 Tax=Brassica carinata TaxID=52824 RepID=A0A8X7WE64_BRACI|nr:hypothetical protein Bca52824_009953 [Brassica carinata]
MQGSVSVNGLSKFRDRFREGSVSQRLSKSSHAMFSSRLKQPPMDHVEMGDGVWVVKRTWRNFLYFIDMMITRNISANLEACIGEMSNRGALPDSEQNDN